MKQVNNADIAGGLYGLIDGYVVEPNNTLHQCWENEENDPEGHLHPVTMMEIQTHLAAWLIARYKAEALRHGRAPRAFHIVTGVVFD